MYNINPNAFRSVFVLPKAVADEHLRAAGKSQLKLLLCLFSHPGEDLTVTQLSGLTGVPKDEIDDDMLYYMMSRGMDEASIREMMKTAYYEAVLRKSPVEISI